MCNYPKYFENIKNPWTGKLYPVPCHHCEGCRVDRRTMWQQRITSEYVKYRCSFITLTYDEYHVNYNKGAVYPTVKNADFGKFIDRLRHRVKRIPVLPKFCTYDWKFVAVSEYGDSHTQRPHFHALLLGLDWLYFKNLIKDCWPCGISDIGPIKKGGIGYVLKYMDKEVNGPLAHEKYTDFGRDIPKMMFSPGIGKDWFLSQIKNINKYGCAKVGQRLIPIPAYWKNKLFNYCDTNIYNIIKRQNDYVEEMDATFRSLGYDSYDGYLRSARKNIERSYEIKKAQKHIASNHLSNEIPSFPLPPLADLFLNYKPSVLQKLLDRPLVFS